jgi:hypothetical protein
VKEQISVEAVPLMSTGGCTGCESDGEPTGGGGTGLVPGVGGLDVGFGGLDVGFGGLDVGFGGLDVGFGGLDVGFGGLDVGFAAVLGITTPAPHCTG